MLYIASQQRPDGEIINLVIFQYRIFYGIDRVKYFVDNFAVFNTPFLLPF